MEEEMQIDNDIYNLNDLNITEKIPEEDELLSLESELVKMSNLFYSSIRDLKDYAPFIAKDNEQNLENSEINKKRIAFEKIENYEQNKNNYQQILDKNAEEMNNIFGRVDDLINKLSTKEEFNSNAEALTRKLNEVKAVNSEKSKQIQEKIDFIKTQIEEVKKKKQFNEAEQKLKSNPIGSEIDFEI